MSNYSLCMLKTKQEIKNIIPQQITHWNSMNYLWVLSIQCPWQPTKTGLWLVDPIKLCNKCTAQSPIKGGISSPRCEVPGGIKLPEHSRHIYI